MTKENQRKEKTIIGSLAGIMAVITLVTIFAVVILRQTAARQQKEELAAQAAVQQTVEEQKEQTPQVQTMQAQAEPVQLPQQMKAAQVQPGREFLTALDNPYVSEIDEEQTAEEIAMMMQDAADLGLDTIFVELNSSEGTLWQSSCPLVSFDVLDTLYNDAHEQGLALYGIYDLSWLAMQDGTMVQQNSVNAQVLDQIANQLKTLVQEGKLDGILLDGYQNPETTYSYDQYSRSGQNISMDSYMNQCTELMVESAVDAVKSANAQLPVGLAVDPVWATSDQAEGGIELNYTQTSLVSDHADTKSMIQNGICDFVVIKNYSSMASETLPFETVADWWNRQLQGQTVTAYMGHASSLAATWQDGWGGNKELANQWQTAQQETAFSGSVFDSLQGLFNDPNYTCYHLTQAWAQSPEADTDTADTYTAQETAGQTENTSVASEDLSQLDGQQYSEKMGLAEEEPTDYQVQDTVSAEVSQEQQEPQQEEESGVYSELNDQFAGGDLLEDMEPVGTRSVADGDTIEITAIARSEASVSATFNGETMQMTKTSQKSGFSGYSVFAVDYEVSAAEVSATDMGNIVVTASLNGQTNTLTGANVIFQWESSSSSGSYGSSNSSSSSGSGNSSNSNNSGSSYVTSYQKPALSTSANKAIGDGTLVQVVSEQALTFPVTKNSIYPDITCYPMPYATMDYVVGDKISIKDGSTYRYYYKLASGRRVYCDDVQAVTGGISIKNNTISNMTVKATSDFTYVILKSDYPVSYLPEYQTGKIKFEFQNTVSTPGDLSLSQNPLFSQASWNGSTLELSLLSDNGFLGYKGYHENGNIVLRFNNPTSIDGARIVVDPGHGGSDPGVADDIDPNWPEKRINWEMSQAIASALEAKGAEVELLDTYNTTTSLDSRLSKDKNFDATLFLCIHANSSETNAAAAGSECYYFYPFSKNLAAKVSSASSDGLSTQDRGAKYEVFYVTRDPQFVGVLAEIGFLTNSTEYSKMQKDSYQQSVGEEIADAVEEYFERSGLEYAGRTGVQSTGVALDASNGPGSSLGVSSSSGSSSTSNSSSNSSSSSSSTGSSESSSSSSSSSQTSSGPVSETVVSSTAAPTGDGVVKYLIFTDPEDKKLDMEVGDTKQLGVKLTGDSSVPKKYTTSNKNVVTIDKNGVVTAVGKGSCKITVVAGDQGGTISVTVS